MPVNTADLKMNSSKLYEMLNTKQAPAVGGKPIFENHLQVAKAFGGRSMADILGHVEKGDSSPMGRSLNFGSKESVGGMPDDTRLLLFGLKKLVNAVEVQAQITFKTATPSADQMMATPLYKNELEPMLKAFNVTDFSTWIPTVNTRFYFEEFEVPLLVGNLFDQMPMDSASIYVPGALGRLFGRLETDAATFGEQSNTQTGFNVLAKNNVVHSQITEDLNQDSAPAIIDKLRKEVVMGVARSEERAYLDGDTTGTHMDADVTAGTDFRKAFKGLRKLALQNSANGVVVDNGGDAVSKTTFANLLTVMKRFSSEKSDLAWIMGPTVANQLVTGAIPELFTAFAFGGPASNVTGQVPPVFGIQATESEWVRENLAATGVYTTSGQTKTWMALVKKSRFMRFLRAPIRVWAAPSLPSSDLMLMTAKKRLSFAGIPQSADELSLAIAINIETTVA